MKVKIVDLSDLNDHISESKVQNVAACLLIFSQEMEMEPCYTDTLGKRRRAKAD